MAQRQILLPLTRLQLWHCKLQLVQPLKGVVDIPKCSMWNGEGVYLLSPRALFLILSKDAEKRIRDREERFTREYEKRLKPVTKEDFDKLYAALESKWCSMIIGVNHSAFCVYHASTDKYWHALHPCKMYLAR